MTLGRCPWCILCSRGTPLKEVPESITYQKKNVRFAVVLVGALLRFTPLREGVGVYDEVQAKATKATETKATEAEATRATKAKAPWATTAKATKATKATKGCSWGLR